MNDFIDQKMSQLKGAEVKLVLVIIRKTIGWGKLSENIGRREFRKRTGLDFDTIKRALPGLCQRLGITVEQVRDRERSKFTWTIAKGAVLNLEKAEREKARKSRIRGELPPQQQGGQITPDLEGQNPSTQYTPNSSERVRMAVDRARERLKALRDAHHTRGADDDRPRVTRQLGH